MLFMGGVTAVGTVGNGIRRVKTQIADHAVARLRFFVASVFSGECSGPADLSR